MPKNPSPLGMAIEAALGERFARHRDPVQYLASFRTPCGAIFACERITKGHINLWLSGHPAVKAAAEAEGLPIRRSVPWQDGREGDYGRISSLKSMPEMRDEPLYVVQVTVAGEAVSMAEALS